MNELEKYFIEEEKKRAMKKEAEEQKQIHILQFTKTCCDNLISKFTFLSKYGMKMEVKCAKLKGGVAYGYEQHYIEVTKDNGAQFLGIIEIPSENERKRCNAEFFCTNGKLREMEDTMGISARDENTLAQVLSQFI